MSAGKARRVWIPVVQSLPTHNATDNLRSDSPKHREGIRRSSFAWRAVLWVDNQRRRGLRANSTALPFPRMASCRWVRRKRAIKAVLTARRYGCWQVPGSTICGGNTGDAPKQFANTAVFASRRSRS